MFAQTELIMGMPITIKIADETPRAAAACQDAFHYFRKIDARYSPFKPTSEVSRINAGLPKQKWSHEMRRVLALCAQTTQQTNGYFNAWHNGRLDPSGLVKGWAVYNAANLLQQKGMRNFYVDAGGDIQPCGNNQQGQPWRIGIRNPFNRREIVKTLCVRTEGVATSGTAIRGAHIYNPHENGAGEIPNRIASLTIIGPNVYEADRFATAAFAMGEQGIAFIAQLENFEGYMIDTQGTATFTNGFTRYVA